MSEPALPDDPSRWPDDPHQLLGVPRDVSPRDLRRAYTRLIRTYKPEQFPEQFRRIRAAYEAALRLAEFFAAPAGEPEASIPAEPPGASAPGSPADDPDVLWERAAAGDEAGAYAALADLHRRRPDRPDLPLRLYWLLALNPDLDPDRPAADWLATALRQTGLTGPALELYRRELDERPAEALTAGERLREVAAAPERVAEVLTGRAKAAVRLKRWDVLRADLAAARERVRPWDEAAWLGLQLTALDGLAWEAGDPLAGALMAECRREVEDLQHLAVRQPEAFDRLDFLLAATAGWRDAKEEADLPPALIELLPRAWARPYAEARPLLVRVLEQVGAAPRNWLRHFDALGRHCPAALAQFGGLLAQYQDRLDEEPPVPHPRGVLAGLVADFLAEQDRLAYGALRPRLLAFCLREAVGPEMVAAVAPPTGVGGALLSEALMADWPLRYVCWACRLFWA